MCAAMGKRDRQPTVLLQKPGMPRKSVQGRLKIAENERLDIGSLPALLQEFGLDGMAEETAVVETVDGHLSMERRKEASQQGKKHEPLHLTNIAGSKKGWFGVWRI